jgi:hypothetical protein
VILPARKILITVAGLAIASCLAGIYLRLR